MQIALQTLLPRRTQLTDLPDEFIGVFGNVHRRLTNELA
jgi:hypothetical protein